MAVTAAAAPRLPIAPSAPPKTPRISFREEIEPILKADCSLCHGKDGAQSGLSLDTPETLRKGGTQFGAKIIAPGSAVKSELIAYLRGVHQPRMPMGRPALSEIQIQKIARWINEGAVIDAVKLRFPYTAPQAFTPPRVRNMGWVRNPVDAFLLAPIEAKGLRPALPASRVSLMRRVYADLIGVPPTPDEQTRFLHDPSPDAYEKLVDRLLTDGRYGERWARHWLDLVRYAETHGFEQDNIRPRAWRYRDYVIRAFNTDRPYDRFVKEQIAGDELYPNDPDSLIASGFARLGTWDELSTDHPQRWQDYLNDATDTTGSVFLGLTVGCARCHDHKYDRITQADYYRLQAFFAGTKWTDLPLPPTNDPPAMQAQRADLEKQRDTFKDQRKALAETEATKAERERLDREIDGLNRRIAPIAPLAEGITDGDAKGPAQHVLLRGDLNTPGPVVEPGFIASLCGGREQPAVLTPPVGGKTTGRRTALAEWMGSPANPLTARVLVNRLWQHHFGRGIVGTPSDFGINGEKPTHPELLDYLARRFVAEGWSIKKMQRLMVLSSAYQQSADTPDPKTLKLDPENRLFTRQNRVRLEGEALRDSILTVSGRLNPTQGGPSIYPQVSDEVLSTGSTHKWGSSPPDQRLRRTVYVFQRRSLNLPLTEAFDGADMSNTCPRRSTTTIAPQALALFNGAFSREEARFFGERVAHEAGTSRTARIDYAYRVALCRAPSASERTRLSAYLDRKSTLYRNAPKPMDAATADQAALTDLCHVLINTNEFLYPD